MSETKTVDDAAYGADHGGSTGGAGGGGDAKVGGTAALGGAVAAAGGTGRAYDAIAQVQRDQSEKPGRPKADEGKPELFVLLSNVSKKQNIGNLVRSASAFGASAVLVCGNPKFSLWGSHGSGRHVTFERHEKLEDAADSLRARGVEIVGVEIMPEAKPVHTHPWTRSCAFMVGNEGTGLSARQKRVCDSFVYIPQYGGGTASLNVTVAASIVLQHFAVWAGFSERARNPDAPEKFLVDHIEARAPGERREGDDAVTEARARERAAMDAAALEVEGGSDLFGDDADY